MKTIVDAKPFSDALANACTVPRKSRIPCLNEVYVHAYEERRVLTVDGKAVLQIRACRGMLQPDGTLRLLAYAGRRCLLSQAETGAASAGQNTTTKKRAAA